MAGNKITAAFAALTVTAITVSYCVTGHIPDVLAMLATTAAGGFLGATVPASR